MGNQELSVVGSTLHSGKESTTTIAFSHNLISQSSSYFLLRLLTRLLLENKTYSLFKTFCQEFYLMFFTILFYNCNV